MNEIINKKLEQCLSKIELNDNCIVVLKGIEQNRFSDINLQNLFQIGTTKSWLSLYQSNVKLISYEEFLYLYNFIEDEYDKIYIVDNNLFNNLYPLNISIPMDIKLQLKEFFDDETDDNISNVQIYDGEKYTKIYSNFKRANGLYFVRYNDESELKSHKITTMNLFEEDNLQELICKTITSDKQKEILIIQEPDDFLYVLEKLLNTNETIAINIESYSGNVDVLKKKIQLIRANFSNFNLYNIEQASKEFKTNPRYKEILEGYWGHKSFRNLKVYNQNDLKQGKKTVEEVSQEKIISDIVDQVEMIIDDKESDYSDVFVTAPTGAGKSAMFLIPAMYLAEKGLVTLVISPLIGLMNDQISNLEKISYKYAKTINSDISQVEKEEIMEDIKNGDCHILYLSPESLLARSDISQIIGDRKIGLIVIDEAHIVTTWGKQFRPDYWYLGDYIKKLRKKQKSLHHPFVVATFTATAIYGGIEDMYTETLDSLNMRKPITYLGYVKRDDIEIKISELTTKKQRAQYQLDKFEALLKVIERARLMDKKTLIYFPNIPLIESFYNYCKTMEVGGCVTKYYGPMLSEEKKENAELFKTKEKLIMLATKAFGMGIDISDIEIVCHFAPTGNVCDYVQEIGRAARDPKLRGEAIYSHMKNDFQHINRLHGLSTVKKYQLIKVIEKVYELFEMKLENENSRNIHLSKKRNEMLVDAENFTYIFEGPKESSQEELIAKVKTALLLIQKDYISKMGFSPFAMRPSTMFAQGYFQIPNNIIYGLVSRYGHSTFRECSDGEKIYLVNLQTIWEKDYSKNLSFPKFKYLLYTSSEELEQYNLNKIIPATCISTSIIEDEKSDKIFKAIKYIIRKSIYDDIQLKIESEKNKNPEKNISDCIASRAGISTFRANSIANILISTIKNYARNYNKTMNSAEIIKPRPLKDGTESYEFNRSAENFILWIDGIKQYIKDNSIDGVLYIARGFSKISDKEIITALGFLESIGYLKFKASGGRDSQIYIYVNQTKTMQEVIRKPQYYNNNLLDKVSERHKISVAMMTFLYQNNFNSETIWNYIENYFLGIIEPQVRSIRNSML